MQARSQVRVLPPVQVLDLSWSGLGTVAPVKPSPMQVLAKVLSLNTTLTHLNLSNNNITAADGAILNKGLLSNSTLRYAPNSRLYETQLHLRVLCGVAWVFRSYDHARLCT